MNLEIDQVEHKDGKLKQVHVRVNQGDWQWLTQPELTRLLIQSTTATTPQLGT